MTHRFVAATALAALMFAAAGRAEDYTWNAGAGGNWNEGAKWTASGGGTGVVPTATDNALIDAAGTYTVNLADARTITTVTLNRSTATLNHTSGVFTVGTFNLIAGTYTLNGGTLTLNGAMTTATGSTFNFTTGTWNGLGSATVNGAFNWNAGVLGGSNSVALTGPITLAGGTKNLTGTKTLALFGDATWSGGTITIDGGNTFRVESGSVMTNTANTVFWWNSSTGGTFDIRGTFRKSGGTGTTEFRNGPVYNLTSTGTLDIQSGTLDVAGNATYAGTVNLGAGPTLRLSNGTQTFAAGAVLNLSAGTVAVTAGTHTADANFSPGTLTMSGGTLTLNGAASAPGTVTFSGGTLNGSGPITAGTAFNWTGGTIAGSNTLTVTGPATFAGTGLKLLTGTKTLVLDADATWSAGTIAIDNGTTFRIAPGRVMTNTADTPLWWNSSTGGTYDFQGTFRKTAGTGTTEFRAGPVYNLTSTGTIDVQSGTLQVAGDATYAGTIILGAGRTLRLTAGTQTFTAGAVLSAPAGTVEVTAGTHTAAANFSPGTLSVSGGTLTLNGAASAPGTLTMTGGTLNGSGPITASTAFNWTGGTIAGSNTLTVTGPATFAGTGLKLLTGTKTLVLDADATWSAGTIAIDNGTTFRIAPGRVMTNTADTPLWWNSSTGGTYDFQGTFRKTAGTGTTEFRAGPVYDVTGTVDVRSGTLQLATGATLVGYTANTLGRGTWRVQGATLDFAGRTVQTIGPNAAVILDGATATFVALNNLTTNNGTLRVLGGKTFTPAAATVTNAGAIEVGPGSTITPGINLQAAGRLEGSGTVTGAVTVGGTIAPGTAAVPVDTLTTGGQTWAGGGVYEISYDQIFGPFTAGTDNDLLNSTGALTVTATPASPFTFRLDYVGTEEFGSRPPDVTIRIATFAGGVPSLDPAAFRLEGETYVDGSTFELTTQGNDVFVTFTPVPESKQALAAVAVGLLGVWAGPAAAPDGFYNAGMTNQLAFVFLAAGAGCCIALQAAANGKFRVNLGQPLYAAFFSICGTFATAIAVMLAARPPAPPMDTLRETQWWNWVGGPLGAELIVLAGATLTSHLGAAVFIAAVVGGQLVCSLALDHFALMGLPEQPITPGRVLGAVLVVAGVVCIKYL